MKKIFILFMLSLIFLPEKNAVAYSDRDICFAKTAEYERREQIRPYILSTIAMVESGRTDENDSLGIYPWPWTVMADGKGRFFANKKDAINEVKRLQDLGKTNIDVGCMQINIGYHGKYFKSIDDMFDPDKNVAYAASFVKSLYNETGFWGEAATRYHSKTASKAERYEIRLADAFSRITKHIIAGGELFEMTKSSEYSKKKTVMKNAIKEKTDYAKLVTPHLREKQVAMRNSSLRTASFDANLYRERKKAEYDIRKQQKDRKGS